MAQEEGIFTQNKLNVDLRLHDYTEAIKLMAKGELDASNQTLTDTLISLGSNSNLDLVIPLYLDVSLGADKVIVSKEIKNIAGLKGKKIATEIGSLDHFLLLLGLKRAGLKAGDVKIENLGLSPGVAAFTEGQVDAVATFSPYTNEAFKRIGSKALFTSKDFPGMITDHLVVSRKLIQERPEQVQALVNSWFDTQNFIRQNPERAYKIMAEQTGISVEEYKKQESEFKFIGFEENLKAFESADSITSLHHTAREINQFLIENHIVSKTPKINQLFEAKFLKNYYPKNQGQTP